MTLGTVNESAGTNIGPTKPFNDGRAPVQAETGSEVGQGGRGLGKRARLVRDSTGDDSHGWLRNIKVVDAPTRALGSAFGRVPSY